LGRQPRRPLCAQCAAVIPVFSGKITGKLARAGSIGRWPERARLKISFVRWADHLIANPVQSLNIDLLGLLQLDKAHGRPRDCLCDRSGIDRVVLVRLHVTASQTAQE
jgi:hypothetical protein